MIDLAKKKKTSLEILTRPNIHVSKTTRRYQDTILYTESSGRFDQKKVDCAWTRDRRSTIHSRSRPPPPAVRGIHLDGTRLVPSRGARGLLVINSLQLTSFAPLEFTVLGDAVLRRGGDYPGVGQERVTCPRHLQFFFSCLAPADGRTCREKWSKNFLEIDRTRLLRLSGG